MKSVIAIDSFKGCLSSDEANDIVALAMETKGWDTKKVMVSDGGEGMLDAFANAIDAQKVKIHTKDALMRSVEACYGVKDDIAIIEVAQAIGLPMIPVNQRNPLRATSYGAGLLIADAIRRGCRHLIIGIGGTATSDCGIGMLKAIIDKFSFGRPDKRFDDIASIFQEHAIDITIASDVENPLLGEKGAARVFAPQKGATPHMVELLERRAKTFADMSAKHMSRDCSSRPGAGAAGGIGYALMQYMNAKMMSGAELLMQLVHIDEEIKDADVVITGEGSADSQTLMGKLPAVVLQHASKAGVKCWLLAGRIQDDILLYHAGYDRVVNINDIGEEKENPLDSEVAKRNLYHTVSNLI